MKIVVTGTRGIPGIQGGIETHCMELYPRIVDENHEVIVIRRPEYDTSQTPVTEYKGVKIIDIKSIRNKHLEAFLHTLKATFYARRVKADVIHIHAVGPSLMVPLARFLGLKVIMTHHGEDYNRQKWNVFAKQILRLGERVGVRYANHVIVISRNLERMIRQRYPSQKNISLIHNGVNSPTRTVEKDFITSLGLKEKNYVLAVGRLVEEKGFDLLIEAFKEIPDKSLKLVIAGGADHNSEYSRKLKEMAGSCQNVILMGSVDKEKLAQLYSNTALFVLPSFHEGLPIVLLEAMSYGCNVLVSNIPANKEVNLSDEYYFDCGNINSLKQGLIRKYEKRADNHFYDLSPYNWDFIAQKTKQLY